MAQRTLGQVLRKLREEMGLSQRGLAAKVKTTGAYIAMLETGAKKKPSKSVLRRLAKVLGVSLEELQLLDKEVSDMVSEAVTLTGAEAVVHSLKRCLAERKVGSRAAPPFSKFGAVVALDKVLKELPERRGEIEALRAQLAALYRQ